MKLQPPIAPIAVEVKRTHRADPRRLRRVAEILLDIIDGAKPLESGSAPGEGR